MTCNGIVTYPEFGKYLLNLRIQSFLSRQQVYELCGVDPASIYRYERGYHLPINKTLRKLAIAYNVKYKELFKQRSNALVARLDRELANKASNGR